MSWHMKFMILFYFLFLMPLEVYSRSENCGTLLVTYLKARGNGQVVFDNSHYSGAAYCDKGHDELNANYRIDLLINDKKTVSKNVFVSNRVFDEEHSTKSGKISLLKSDTTSAVYSLIKFSIPETAAKEIEYKVYQIPTNQMVGRGFIPLKKL
jgi:hypothetical protein